MMKKINDVLPSYTFRVETPDGTMYTIISESNDRPVRVEIQIGKTGTSIRAWSFAMAAVVTLLLEKGTPVNEIAIVVSDISTEKISHLSSGINIRSGPEGLVYCLIKYVEQKRREGGRDKNQGLDFGLDD